MIDYTYPLPDLPTFPEPLVGWLTITPVPIPLPCRFPRFEHTASTDPVAELPRCGTLGTIQLGADGGILARRRIPGSVVCDDHLREVLGPQADEVFALIDNLEPLETIAVAGLAS